MATNVACRPWSCAESSVLRGAANGDWRIEATLIVTGANPGGVSGSPLSL